MVLYQLRLASSKDPSDAACCLVRGVTNLALCAIIVAARARIFVFAVPGPVTGAAGRLIAGGRAALITRWPAAIIRGCRGLLAGRLCRGRFRVGVLLRGRRVRVAFITVVGVLLGTTDDCKQCDEREGNDAESTFHL